MAQEKPVNLDDLQRRLALVYLDDIPHSGLVRDDVDAITEAVVLVQNMTHVEDPEYREVTSLDHCMVELPMEHYGKQIFVLEQD